MMPARRAARQSARTSAKTVHASIWRAWTSLKDFAPGLLLPGVKINTSETDYATFDRLGLARFDGQSWAQIDGESASR